MFKNILLATDFSKHAETARKVAISMAKEENKTLTVLHVYDEHQKMLDEGVFIASQLVESAEKKRFEADAEIMLGDYCIPIERQGIKCNKMVKQGKAPEEIVKIAEESNADLIIIGSHSKRGFIDVTLGGVTRKVGEVAPCPVLIVTHFEEKGEMSEGKE